MAALMSAIGYGMLNGHEFGAFDNPIHNGVSRDAHPWDKVNLSKADRRGKTYEELQALRKQKYEEAQEAIQSDNAKFE
jgi:hypothetical protein